MQYRRAFALLALAACSSDPVAPATSPGPGQPARNVILFIGDGMGVQQVGLLTQYRRLVKPDSQPNAFERLANDHHLGVNDVFPVGNIVVDSAASATQMACGVPTRNEVVGLDADGYPCLTVLEEAHALGKATGLVTDTRVTHATPAAFAAKASKRDAENDIAEQLVRGTGAGASPVDVQLGGGAQHLLPRGARFSQHCPGLPAELDGTSKRQDDRDLLVEAREAGYEVVCNAAQLEAVAESEGSRVLGVMASSGYPAYPERHEVSGLPSLYALTAKSLRLLESDPDGFFLMVEAGQIDWAGHANDPGYLIAALREAEQVLQQLLAYVASHPDTLLVVTADHETGGLAFSYTGSPLQVTPLPSGRVQELDSDFVAARKHFAFLDGQRRSLGALVDPIAKRLYPQGSRFTPAEDYGLDQASQDLYQALTTYTSYPVTREQARAMLEVPRGSEHLPQVRAHDEFYPSDNFSARISHALTPETKLLFATGTHTSTPVEIFAAGPAHLASLVRGYGHNTRVADIVRTALRGE